VVFQINVRFFVGLNMEMLKVDLVDDVVKLRIAAESFFP
jgi:hypothetical protein